MLLYLNRIFLEVKDEFDEFTSIDLRQLIKIVIVRVV